MEIRQANTSVVKTPQGSFYQSEPLIVEQFNSRGYYALNCTSTTPTGAFYLGFHKVTKDGTIDRAFFWIQSITGTLPSNQCVTAKFYKLGKDLNVISQVGDTATPTLAAASTITALSTATTISVTAGEILGLELSLTVVPTGSTAFQFYKNVTGMRVPGCGFLSKSENTGQASGNLYAMRSYEYPNITFKYTDGTYLGSYYLNSAGGQSHTLMSSGAFPIWTGFRFYNPRRIRIFNVSAPFQRAGTVPASGGNIQCELYWMSGTPETVSVSGTIPASSLTLKGTSPNLHNSGITTNIANEWEFQFPEGIVVDPGWVFAAFRQPTNSSSATEGYRLGGGTPTYLESQTWPFLRLGQFNRYLQFFSSTGTSALTPILNQLGAWLQAGTDGAVHLGYAYTIEPYILQ